VQIQDSTPCPYSLRSFGTIKQKYLLGHRKTFADDIIVHEANPRNGAQNFHKSVPHKRDRQHAVILPISFGSVLLKSKLGVGRFVAPIKHAEAVAMPADFRAATLFPAPRGCPAHAAGHRGYRARRNFVII
jgi:hypothetical protein